MKIKVVVTCEHAANRVPSSYKHLFKRSVLATHRGYDVGAAKLYEKLAGQAADFGKRGEATRLLVDLNRSIDNDGLFSKYSVQLTRLQKKAVLKRWYLPYRSMVEKRIKRFIRAGHIVIHVSVHSFTPVMRGRVRKVDIGLLFDPRRALELCFCRAWRSRLARMQPALRVRFNQPYRGTDDGFTTHLRSRLPASRYLGIELEVNQKFTRHGGKRWSALQRQLVKSFELALHNHAAG